MKQSCMVTVFACCMVSFSFAGPQILTYQDQALSPSGSPIPNGTYRMRFRLYDASAYPAGTVRWTEIDPSVTVTGGHFTTLLGDAVPFGTLFSTYPNLWIEVAIDLDRDGAFDPAEVYSPRRRLTASPWAMESDRLQGHQANSFAPAVHAHPSLQQRVTGVAPAGRYITAINADGSVNTAPDRTNIGTITAVTAGTGLTGGGTSGSVTLAARFEGSGTRPAVARADHTHTATVTWVEVTANSLASPNHGYMVNSAQRVTITLPTSVTLHRSDTIRVSGAGAGGWKIAPNVGQTIHVVGLPDQASSWIPRESSREWRSIASSADGRKLVACVWNGRIYTSADYGVTWTPRESTRYWSSVASSADGSKLVACAYGGQMYTSSNFGVTWISRESSRNWNYCASSADGSRLVASVWNGQIYTSADYGVTWTPRESNRQWNYCASSADGRKLIACVWGGQIYTSADYGVTWTARESTRWWTSVASSADGSKLVAGASGDRIYTSSDSGATWTPRESNRIWAHIASSTDGSKLVAPAGGVVFTGQIYLSKDSGVSWIPQGSERNWQGVASSADGGKLVAIVAGGLIYTCNTDQGTNRFLCGDQYSAVELQYIGLNTFMALSFVGSLGLLRQ